MEKDVFNQCPFIEAKEIDIFQNCKSFKIGEIDLSKLFEHSIVYVHKDKFSRKLTDIPTNLK